MTDGVGTTAYAYNPIPTTPTLGAGKLASVTGPIANSTISYTYDELGRMAARSINGAANTISVHYDPLGRVDQMTNLLGVFNYGYVGASRRVDHLDYPNGQQANYAYYPNISPAGVGNGDQRIQQIQNLRPGGANLSTFGYTYDGNGQIQTWSQQNDAGAALSSSFKYDAAGQLTDALVPTAASIIKSYVYRYDKSGNRTSEQIDSSVTAAAVNNVNQVTAVSPSGPIRFAGTVSEPGTVTVNGLTASVDAANNFSADVPLSPGMQTVAVVATDTSNNKTTKNYQVVVANGVSRNLQYDQAGNEIDDGSGKIYAWDAANRLVKITQASGIIEFIYDGASRCVQEKLNGALIKQWVWCDEDRPAEERDANGNVTKRFYDRGEQIGGSIYFFTTDHLDSIREMTDASGTVRARYVYDAYGRTTKVAGDLEADFGYASYFRHAESGLYETWFRFYDPDAGRWLNRDPLEEYGGLNLYAYVANNPVNATDSLGLTTSLIGAPPALLTEFGIAVSTPTAGSVATTVAVGVGTVAVVVHAEEGDKTKGDAQAVPAPTTSDVTPRDPCKGLEKQIADHLDKLDKYKSNPDAYDNKDFLKNNPQLRDKIIESRIRSLLDQISNFRRLLENCRKLHPKK